VSGVNSFTSEEEILHLDDWAADNNLTLNRVKSKEPVFTASPKTVLPPPRPDIERVTSLRILGVVVNKLTSADHVTSLLSSSSSLLFAMRVLHASRITTRLEASVRGASMVGDVFGCRPSAS